MGVILNENKLVIIIDRNAVRKGSSKQVFLKISQYAQEKTCVGVSF